MKTDKMMLSMLCMLITLPTIAQDVVGFWVVTKVEVGNEIMTPIAKWTNIHKNGTYDSGNGWLQNGAGTWTYDQQTKSFNSIDTYGLKDEYGAFDVSFNENHMTWIRQEEGSTVKVTLERIDSKPKAPADWLVGLWDLKKAEKAGENIIETYDPKNSHYFFIRWDRIYVQRTSDGERTTGYWHINGHKPELTLLSHNEAQPSLRWKVEANEKTLLLTGLSASNKGLVLQYFRIKEFPN